MDYLKAIIIEYHSKGIVVDTNILILYLVGSYDINYIDKCSRVKNKQYKQEDFNATHRLLSSFSKLIITPQILAEVSNLSFKDIKDQKFNEYFKRVLLIITDAEEKYIHKDILLKIPILKKFGFTDSSIYEIATKYDYPVITDDFKLFNLLINSNVYCINMDHIRFNK